MLGEHEVKTYNVSCCHVNKEGTKTIRWKLSQQPHVGEKCIDTRKEEEKGKRIDSDRRVRTRHFPTDKRFQENQVYALRCRVARLGTCTTIAWSSYAKHSPMISAPYLSSRVSAISLLYLAASSLFDWYPLSHQHEENPEVV